MSSTGAEQELQGADESRDPTFWPSLCHDHQMQCLKLGCALTA